MINILEFGHICLMCPQGGADLNMTNMKGNTALHEALRRKHFQTANCLLAAGADPRMKNFQGKLPLDETNVGHRVEMS